MKDIKTYLKILVTVSVVLVATYFAREELAYRGIENDLSSWGVFFSVFGVVYAIIAGFLLVEVLQKFGNVTSSMDEEVNSLRDTRDFLIYIDGDEKAKKEIKKSLRTYSKSVVDTEWAEMADMTTPTDADTSPELKDLIVAVNGINVTNESDSVALNSIISEVSKITTHRSKRIGLSDAEIPPSLKVLLVFMSAVLVIGFVFMSVENIWVHMLLVGSVVVAIQLMYMIISDLDTPFDGVWNLSDREFREFSTKVD